MANNSSAPLQPTWRGYLSTTWDAMLLMEASLQGIVRHIPRRPHDRERTDLIKSGNVFVYEEGSSGIKRWTDGSSWSPSRIMNNYLIYRELDAPFPPGEKKRALKKTQKRPAEDDKLDLYNGSFQANSNNSQNHGLEANGDPNAATDSERALFGSLVDSYNFKEDGLMKKTFAIKLNNITHHLVSYYKPKDVLAGHFARPSDDAVISQLFPRDEILFDQAFRFALDVNETGHHHARYAAAFARRQGQSQMMQHHGMMANAPVHGGYYTQAVNIPQPMAHMESSQLEYNPTPHYHSSWGSQSGYGASESFDTSTGGSYGDHAPLGSHQGLSSFSSQGGGLPTPGYDTTPSYEAPFPSHTNYTSQHTYNPPASLPSHGSYPSYSSQTSYGSSPSQATQGSFYTAPTASFDVAGSTPRYMSSQDQHGDVQRRHSTFTPGSTHDGFPLPTGMLGRNSSMSGLGEPNGQMTGIDLNEAGD